jgi:hypothetical protein
VKVLTDNIDAANKTTSARSSGRASSPRCLLCRTRVQYPVPWNLAGPGPGPADRSAAGAMRGAARRRPGHRPRGGRQHPALHPRGRQQIWSLMQPWRQLRPQAYGAGAATSTEDGLQPPTHRDRDGPMGVARSFRARATASLSALCTRPRIRRITSGTCKNDVPLHTAMDRSDPMACGPDVDQPAPTPPPAEGRRHPMRWRNSAQSCS